MAEETAEELTTRLLLAHERELTRLRTEFDVFQIKVVRALKEAGIQLAEVNAVVAGQVPREERPESANTEKHQTGNDVHDFVSAEEPPDYKDESTTDGKVELANASLTVKWASSRAQDLCPDCGQIHNGNRVVDERGKIVIDPKPCPA